jgi:hypothetical protein
MLVADAKAGDGIIVLDAVGDWSSEIVWRLVEETDRADDIVILDPRDRPTFSLPIYRHVSRTDQDRFQRAVDASVGVYAALYGLEGSRGTSWGPVLSLLATAIGHTFCEAGATLEDVASFLTREDVRHSILAGVTNPKIHQYWADFFPQRQREQMEYFGSFINKVLPFSFNETVAAVAGQHEATVDVRQLMDEQKIVILPLRAGEIGDDAASLIGSNFISEIYNAVRSRSDTREDRRRQCMLYIDECQLFQHPALPKLDAQARKFRLGIVKANQHLDQLPEALQATARMSTNLFIGRQSGTHAAILAGDFNNPPAPGEPDYKPIMIPSAGHPGRWEQYRIVYGDGWGSQDVTQYTEAPGSMVEVAAMRERRANRIVMLPFYQFMGRFRSGNEIAEATFRALPSPTFGREMPRSVKARIAEIRKRSRRQMAAPVHRRSPTPVPSSPPNGMRTTRRREEVSDGGHAADPRPDGRTNGATPIR